MKPGTYPQIRRSPEGLADLVSDRPNWVGNDLEFTAREEPTHCSLSVDRGDKAWALTWDACKSVLLDLIKSKVQFVGHAWLTADRPIIQRELGLEIPLEQSHDTMIMHYLCNAELTALPKTGRQAEDDPEVRRGAGHMDLWTMASIYTLLPQWKKCRGRYCQGPCPEHDFEGYNGVDAVAPDIAYPALQEDMKRKGIPDSLYLHMKRLALVCNKMKRRGIRVDRQYITELGERLDAEKDRLFKKIQVREACAVCARLKKNPPPCKTCVKLGLVNDAGHGYRLRDSWDAPFNPNSPQAVVSWFDARGVGLRGTTKDEIFKQLQKVNRNPEQYDDDAVKWLRLLHDYKEGGKGLKAWFDERYINAIGLAHPRFIECGTSTGRLASSNPNFQNLPKHGFGREVRRAIVPRSPERLLLKADYKQLELRMVLWCSGVTEDFTDDAFTWLVQANPGLQG